MGKIEIKTRINDDGKQEFNIMHYEGIIDLDDSNLKPVEFSEEEKQKIEQWKKYLETKDLDVDFQWMKYESITDPVIKQIIDNAEYQHTGQVRHENC